MTQARRTGPALETMYRFLLWLVPAVEKFPRRQKFLLGDRIQELSTNWRTFTYTRARRDHACRGEPGYRETAFSVSPWHKDLHHVNVARYEHAKHVGQRKTLNAD